MAEKSQKQKSPKNQALYLFTYRNDLLFLTYDLNHPKRIDIDQFTIGKLRLFKSDKVYSAELKSKPFLNPSLMWNAETFELMVRKFDEFVYEEENIDFSQWLFVSVYIKVKGKEINLVRIRLLQEFGIDPQIQLWNEFKKFNTFKAKSSVQTHKTIQSLEGQIQVTLNRLQKTQQEQNQKVQDVKKKLSALMYQKQKKIMELTGNHTYQWEPEQDSSNSGLNRNASLNVEPSQNMFMSSQDDRMMVGSLFAPSQDFLI